MTQTQDPKFESNPFQLVNTVAKQAKVMVYHDPNAQLSRGKAINQALKANTPEAPVHKVRR